MIDNPEPVDWRVLQDGVCRILNEIGLQAQTNVEVLTPRGRVTLDVYAIDSRNIDNILYIVECKNWNTHIPQSVVHSFTTVMHEVGANVGYIITKHGFQSGATDYMKNTNIRGITYGEFQNHYFNEWINCFFRPTISDIADSLIQYTEPVNSYRDKYISNLTKRDQKYFSDLYNRYSLFGMCLSIIITRTPIARDIQRPDCSIEALNSTIERTVGFEYRIDKLFLRDFLLEFCGLINNITDNFNKFFGKDIFKQR
jgi:restriction system protein